MIWKHKLKHNMPTERKCKLCKKPGHNRRTCKFHTVSVVTPKPPVIESDTCPICMETLEKTNYASTKCGHQFCLECLIRHVGNKSNCPICRTPVGKPVPAPAPGPRTPRGELFEWPFSIDRTEFTPEDMAYMDRVHAELSAAAASVAASSVAATAAADYRAASSVAATAAADYILTLETTLGITRRSRR